MDEPLFGGRCLPSRLASRRLPEGLGGIGELHQLLAQRVEQPDQVVIGIETDRGLWGTALVGAGYQVYAINPMAAARYRDCHRVPGAKSRCRGRQTLG